MVPVHLAPMGRVRKWLLHRWSSGSAEVASSTAGASAELGDYQQPMTFRPEHLIVPLVAVAASTFWLWQSSLVTSPGFPLDDAWIHLQFARNFAEGHGFSFNAGVPSSGSTAPLWSLILALVVVSGVDPVTAAVGLGIAITCATVAAAIELTRLATGSRLAGIVAGLTVAVSGRVVWAAVSGMEGPLFSLLTVAALLAYVVELERPERSWGAWSLLAALAGTARPEAFVTLLVLAVHWTIGPGSAARRRSRRALAAPLLTAGVVIVAYVSLNIHGGGHLLPMTFYAKTGEGGVWHALRLRELNAIHEIGAQPLVALNKLSLFFIGHSALLYAPAIVGLLALADVFRGVQFRAGAGLLVAVLLLTPLLKGLVAPTPSILTHQGRYITNLTVLWLVASVIGFVVLHRMSRRRWVVPVVLLLALARLGTQDLREARLYGEWVKNINDLQVVAGRWIADHTSADAVVATNDIGAIGYISRRPVIDTEGLVTPEAIPYKQARQIASLLEATRPDLLVVFPDWYPDLAGSPLLTEVHRFRVRRVVAGGTELVVYRLPWTRPDRLRMPR